MGTGLASPWRLRAVSLVLLVACGLAAFAPAFGAGFLNFDDDHVITRNLAFRGLSAEHLEWMATTGLVGHYHPLTWLTFALDHARAGLEPGAYHATNVALHLATAAAFLFLARALLARALPGTPAVRIELAALSAALAFAVHPQRVESVVWVTERRDVLSGLFFVACVLAWVRFADRRALPAWSGARALGAALGAAAGSGLVLASISFDTPGTLGRGGLGLAGVALGVAAIGASAAVSARASTGGRGWAYALAVVALALSLLAKAWGLVMPALLLVLDAVPLARLAGRRGARAWGALALEKAPFWALALVFGRLASWAQASQVATMKDLGEHGVVERAVQGLYGLAYYPLRFVAPVGLVPIYELPDELSFAEPRFLLASLSVLGGAALLFALRRRAPALVAAFAAFAVIVSPVLGVLQSGPQLVADRYAYLATLPFALVVGGALVVAARRGRAVGSAAAVLVGLAIAAAAVETRRLSGVWSTSRSLWEYAHRVEPEAAMPYLSLGHALLDDAAAPELDLGERRALVTRAIGLFERGRALRPNARFLGGLALAHVRRVGLDPERRAEHAGRAVEAATAALAESRERGEYVPEYRLNLGVALVAAGRIDDAVPHLTEYVAARPDDANGHFQLGQARALLGRPREAIGPLRMAVTIDPTLANGWGQLGTALEATGDRAGAVRSYRRVLELLGDHPPTRERLRALGAQ